MSRAGKAGEVGSVFRCAVATHVAVHGLRGRPIAGLGLAGGVDPVRLDFETADPTDDIVITFSDGSRGYLSAKRKLEKGRPLLETLAGWVGQAAALRSEDLLIVACEDFAGPVRRLDEVLQRYRQGLPMAGEEERLLAFLDAHVPAPCRDLVLRRARVLHLPGSTGRAPTRDFLAALMDLVVADEQGFGAVDALSGAFHRQAGAGLGSGVDDWVRTLQQAKLTVLEGRDGPPGVRAAARSAAVDRYRTALRAGVGRIDLSLLADDLPPLVVEELLDGIEVKAADDRRPQRLLGRVRRWRRMILVGQPGAGKSVALRELAGHCAADPHAPLPIPVSLPRLLEQHPEELTLSAMVESAVRDRVGAEHRGPLTEHLTAELGHGRAIILCDGLDECRERAAWVAQQLADLMGDLNPAVGFLVATRMSARRPAGRLGLPLVELCPPTDLGATVDRVLESCAEVRVPEPERNAWLMVRRDWIKQAKGPNDHLLAVPLLAVLLALVCANATEAELPRGRAVLLHAAVERSVERWERLRGSGARGESWTPELTTSMLLGGFTVLGRLLDGGKDPTRDEALGALTAMLADPGQWAVAPAAAREIAVHVLRFWDEHVAVFVIGPEGVLTARSKVFTEIATAMWARSRDTDGLALWLDAALGYTDSDGAVALAAELNPAVARVIIDLGRRDHPELGLVVADLARRGSVSLAEEEAGALLGLLAAAVRASNDGVVLGVRRPRRPKPWQRSAKRPPAADAWPFVEAACLLGLPAPLRPVRDALVAEARLDDRAVLISLALRELVDADVDRRPWDATGLAYVESALALPLPEESGLVQTGRRSFALAARDDIPGLAEVALLAAGRLPELPAGTDEKLFHIAQKCAARWADGIFVHLERSGYDTGKRWEGVRDSLQWFKDMGRRAEECQESLLDDLSALAPVDVRERTDLWSMTALGDLIAVAGCEEASMDDYLRGFRRGAEEQRRALLRTLARAYGLDRTVVAGQARHLIDLDAQDREVFRSTWSVVATKPWRKPSLREPVATVLTQEEQRTLVTAMGAAADWFAWAAAEILVNTGVSPWITSLLLKTDTARMTLNRAALVHSVAVMVAGDRRPAMLAEAARSERADRRYAAAMVLSLMPELDPDGSLADGLRRDPDLTVRTGKVLAGDPGLTCWTCNFCRAVNVLEAEDCTACTPGARPSLERRQR
ncbi:hypothetical protein [Kitasatospora sp. NPDC004272]